MNMLPFFMDPRPLNVKVTCSFKTSRTIYAESLSVTSQKTGILKSNTSFTWKMKALWQIKTTGNNPISQHHIPRRLYPQISHESPSL